MLLYDSHCRGLEYICPKTQGPYMIVMVIGLATKKKTNRMEMMMMMMLMVLLVRSKRSS